jgi:hypothetical protein
LALRINPGPGILEELWNKSFLRSLTQEKV